MFNEDVVTQEIGEVKNAGFVSDVDLSKEPLKVQRLCWEMLDYVESKNNWISDSDLFVLDWLNKVTQLPRKKAKRCIRFANTLRVEELDLDDSPYHDATGSRPHPSTTEVIQ
jgi:hypothetical protein